MAISALGGAVWRHADFLRLWAGQAVSAFGDQIPLAALPLTAVLPLHADASHIRLLRVVRIAPFALIGLFLGVCTDRRRRRPSPLIMADALRACDLAAIPLFAILNGPSMPDLYAVAFTVGGGGLLGALMAGRVVDRWGVGAAIALGAAVSGLGDVVLPPASRARPPVSRCSSSVSSCSAWAARSTASSRSPCVRGSPGSPLGRMNASVRFVAWGAIPMGAPAGGILGGDTGPRATLWVAGAGGLLAVAGILRSPVLGTPTHPAAAEPGGADEMPAPAQHGRNMDAGNTAPRAVSRSSGPA